MSGSPRDLAVHDPWNASLQRSRARRARANRGRSERSPAAAVSPSALLDTRTDMRDLADEEPWQLSLGRSRARRRAAELRFVPASSRAKRVSLGALAAFTVGPTASLASGQATINADAPNPEPPTTTEHSIILTSGSEGRQVRLLQQALGSIKVDGIFGPETEQAVRSFQSGRGLSVDGVVGPLTSAALRSAGAGKAFASFKAPIPGESAETPAQGTAAAQATTADAPEPEASTQGSTSPATGTTTGTEGEATPHTEGNPGSAVAHLQAALHLKTDGEFGPQTEAAVRRLQARHGLSVDGIVGPATWGVIGVHGTETLTPPPSAMPAPPRAQGAAAAAPVGGESTAGEAPAAGGNAVARLQAALHLPVDGEFGPETEAAVRRLQARHGLPVDGVVGPTTWGLIGVSDEGALTPPPSSLVAPSSGGGASTSTASHAPAAGGNAVARLQAALHLPVDGEFGTETEAAVRRLQARHGLPVDGVVGPTTWGLIGVSDEGTLTPPPSSLVAPSSGGGASTSTAGGEAGGEGPSAVAGVIAAADEIATRPYVWGGGHGSFASSGYDCSGSVSYALHGGGLLGSPEDSTGLESFGEPGPGRYITIYANSEHAYMVVDGKRFDTVALQEGGSRWGGAGSDGGGFVERHPAGL